MGKIESRTGKLSYDDKKVFSFISDFTNFNNIIPVDRIEGWQATPDNCTFSIGGIGKAGMKIIQREPFNLIKIVSDDTTPIHFTMWIQLKNISPDTTKVKITIDPDVNMAIMMVVKNPLKSFIDDIVDQMEKFSF